MDLKIYLIKKKKYHRFQQILEIGKSIPVFINRPRIDKKFCLQIENKKPKTDNRYQKVKIDSSND